MTETVALPRELSRAQHIGDLCSEFARGLMYGVATCFIMTGHPMTMFMGGVGVGLNAASGHKNKMVHKPRPLSLLAGTVLLPAFFTASFPDQISENLHLDRIRIPEISYSQSLMDLLTHQGHPVFNR